MKCVICKHGDTDQGVATVTFERAGFVLVVKGVPARVCSNCGEQYVDDRVAENLLKGAESDARNGAVVEIRQYIAA